MSEHVPGVTVADLVATLKSRRVRMPAEIGAFVALEACDAMLESPSRIQARDVRVADDGQVRVRVTADMACSATEAAEHMVMLLASLLVTAGTAVPPVLLALAEGTPAPGNDALVRLRDDLESALVPLNRGASRRVLSRLIREARRAILSSAERLDEVPEAQLESALSELLSATPGGARAGAGARREPGGQGTFASSEHPAAGEVEGGPSSEDDGGEAGDRRDGEDATGTGAAGEGGESSLLEALTESQGRGDGGWRVPLDGATPGAASPGQRRSSRWVWLLAWTLCAGAALVWLRTRGGEPGLAAPVDPVPAPSRQARAPGPAAGDGPSVGTLPAGLGDLTIRCPGVQAQVFLFVGRSPAVAAALPTGRAQEFLAVVDGRGAARAVVPADARWTPGPSGLQYDLAMEVPMAATDPMQAGFGATLLSRDSLGVTSGELGTIRVVTAPPAAKVFRLVGFTPEARVSQVPTDAALEVLVYLEGSPVERRVVGPSDWVVSEGQTPQAVLDVGFASDPGSAEIMPGAGGSVGGPIAPLPVVVP